MATIWWKIVETAEKKYAMLSVDGVVFGKWIDPMIADCGPPLDISSIFQSIMKWIFLFRCRFHNGWIFSIFICSRSWNGRRPKMETIPRRSWSVHRRRWRSRRDRFCWSFSFFLGVLLPTGRADRRTFRWRRAVRRPATTSSTKRTAGRSVSTAWSRWVDRVDKLGITRPTRFG